MDRSRAPIAARDFSLARVCAAQGRIEACESGLLETPKRGTVEHDSRITHHDGNKCDEFIVCVQDLEAMVASHIGGTDSVQGKRVGQIPLRPVPMGLGARDQSVNVIERLLSCMNDADPARLPVHKRMVPVAGLPAQSEFQWQCGPGSTLTLDPIERVVRMAQEKSLEGVIHDYRLDLLNAVPADRVSSEEPRTRRWPQIPSSAAPIRSVDSVGINPRPNPDCRSPCSRRDLPGPHSIAFRPITGSGLHPIPSARNAIRRQVPGS
jgi:hypothetical protein